jgi:hypothetical protein
MAMTLPFDGDSIDRGCGEFRRFRFQAPIEAEPRSMPFDNGLGLNGDQNFSPIFPEPRQNYPEELVSPVKRRA